MSGSHRLADVRECDEADHDPSGERGETEHSEGELAFSIHKDLPGLNGGIILQLIYMSMVG